MPQSLAQIYLHVVFSTKDRKPFLTDPDLLKRAHEYLGGICRTLDCPSLTIGGVADHVHILCRLSKTMAPSDFVRELKRDSSKKIKTMSAELETFHWQNGYGAFSISPAHVDPLVRYIANQEKHHRKESFQDEFRRILQKYGVEYDERYVWD